MCGIVGVFQLKKNSQEQRERILELSKKLRHRGPDWSGIYCGDNAILAHERLTIVDPQSGGQPLYSPDGKVILAVNGEIYNHQEIRENYNNYEFKTNTSTIPR
jgi:asparagine synthase (glutamine-hydrolysing)